MKHLKNAVLSSIAGLAFFGFASSSNATVLDFDGVISGTTNCPVGAFAADCSFSFGGYDFDGFGFDTGGTPHVGDGAGGNNTINWHTGGANGNPAGYIMTVAGGGNFNLSSMDIFAVAGDTLGIAADFGVGFMGLGSFVEGSNQMLNITNALAVRFEAFDANLESEYVGFDNMVVSGAPVFSGVPEPASLALFSLGLAGLGLSRRKKA